MHVYHELLFHEEELHEALFLCSMKKKKKQKIGLEQHEVKQVMTVF